MQITRSQPENHECNRVANTRNTIGMGLRMTARLARTTVALALSTMTLTAHAGAITTLMAVPWGLIHLAVTKLSEQSAASAPPAKSTPADTGLNHWVFRSAGEPKLPPVLALAQLQKDFTTEIRAKTPLATISTHALTIPAPERAASSTLTPSGWLACEDPVLVARAEGEKNRRLHVCVTHSQAGLQTAIFVFDAERHRPFGTLPFGKPAPTGEFLSDPEGQAGELVQQLKSALEKTFGATELVYSGTVRPPKSQPVDTSPAPGG